MYHISDVKKFIRCPRLFLNGLAKKNEPFNSYIRLDEAFTELACQKLHLTNYFLGQRNDAKELALEAMNEQEWLVKARFEYNQLRIKVPFLHKVEHGWDVYFLFCGNKPKEDDMVFYCATIWVLQKNGINIDAIHIIHLNEEYVRDDSLDANQLFILSDMFYNGKGTPTKNVKNVILKNMRNFDPVLKLMDEVKESGEVPVQRSNKCTKRNKCVLYDTCFPEEETIVDDSILTLNSSQYKYQMNEEGLSRLKDANIDLIEGSRIQYAQIEASKQGGLYVDRLALETWMNDIKFPITFLDFEWERYAIPPYKGMRPYDVLPFEYSIHVMEKDGTITHREFIGIHDCREEIIQGLLKDIPSKGSIVAYNADGAEKIRIQEFASTFPQYEQKLKKIHSRFVDMQLPFATGVVYDVRMRGFFSLKTIMAMLDDEGYRNLDIHQGMDAVFEWRHLDKQDESVNRDAIVEGLRAYCGMDTYAMTVVYKWLKSLCVSSQKCHIKMDEKEL